MAALEVFNSPCGGAVQGLTAMSFGHSKRTALSKSRLCQLQSHCSGTQLRKECDTTRLQNEFLLGRRKTFISRSLTTPLEGGGETSISDEETPKPASTNGKLEEETTKPASKEKVEKRRTEIRTTITEFLEKKSGYSWLLGPAAVTAAIVIPSTSVNLVTLFQKNFLLGLAALFFQDLLFVLATDLFLVLSDKLGHHQQVSGGPPPWIGPWEYTGYPKGYPKVLQYITYASVGVSILAMVLSLFTGKLAGALATFGPFLGVIFAQVAYERLLGNDRSPVSPMVPIVYTVYRLRQLSRALVLLPFIADGSGILTRCIHLSSVLWALYLGIHMTQLPWLYSTWNSNKAT
ncbi:unnamed protein product [Calypogeia fissa]